MESFGEKLGAEQKEVIEDKEKKDENLIFEVEKKIGNFDVSVGIEKGKEPIRGSIDLENKRIEARITPEGVKKGIELIRGFFKKPEGADERMEEIKENFKSFAERDFSQEEKPGRVMVEEFLGIFK